eukprot:evm.model.scf_159.7 EVM.evm.TU.scf_159.7   scf_159:41288-43554(+)
MAGTLHGRPRATSYCAVRPGALRAQWTGHAHLRQAVQFPTIRQNSPVSCTAGRLASFPVLAAAAAADSAVEELEAKAILRYTRGSPHKMRRVLDTIRGRSYEEALMILEYMPYRACQPILKTLVSAAANAKHNLGLKKSKLYVSECYADPGPTLKRFLPRAKGRADRIHKPSSHITIKVKERAVEEVEMQKSVG